MLKPSLTAIVVTAALAGTALPNHARAEDFYSGKTIRLGIAAGPGGGFDTIARTIGEHLGKHVPGNPSVVPENRVGAGGRVMANWLYGVAPKDGLHIGMLGPWSVFEPFWDQPGVQFEPAKFNWLVSANREASSCMFWKGRGVETFRHMQAKEIKVGSYGPTSAQTQDALALNALLGTKLSIIHGYKGTNDTMLAVERGEIDGTCGIWASSAMSAYSSQIQRGDLKVVVQLGFQDHPDFKGIENPIATVTNPEDQAALRLIFGQLDIARPFAAPPGVPADRVATLRKAFWSVLQDPELIASAKRQGLDLRPLEGEKVQAFVEEVFKTPKAAIERAKKIQGY
jgi:tripartite-type tricarboxylate transporter receptor subunit TctC